jgi:hypothetical protein
MDPVKQISLEPGVTSVTFAENQTPYAPLPALIYPDGTVLVEWHLTDEERERIARGEDLRHWIWKGVTHHCTHCGAVTPALLQPTLLEVTDERIT